jgi:hypothetical protein
MSDPPPRKPPPPVSAKNEQMGVLMRREGSDIFSSDAKQFERASGESLDKLLEGVDPQSEIGKALAQATKAMEEFRKLLPENPDQPKNPSDDDDQQK